MNVSGDVCDTVVSHCLMSEPAACLSKLTGVKMNKISSWCQRFCVLSDVESGSKFKLCSSGRDAGHCCFGSSKATSERERESSRMTLWMLSVVAMRQTTVGHNEALDRTMCATRLKTVNDKVI